LSGAAPAPIVHSHVHKSSARARKKVVFAFTVHWSHQSGRWVIQHRMAAATAAQRRRSGGVRAAAAPQAGTVPDFSGR